MTLDEVLHAFELHGRKVTRQGDAAMVSCPGPAHRHGDRNLSLSISIGNKGVVLHCFAGDSTEDVLASVGLEARDLFYSSNGKQPRKPKPRPIPEDGSWRTVATYRYLDRDSKPVYQITRDELFDASGRPVLRENGKPEKRFNSKGVTKDKRIPYHLDELEGAKRTGERVFLVEGEKCADFLRTELNAFATTLGSVDAFDSDRHACYFDELAQVVVLPDESENARKSFLRAAEALAEVVPDVRFVMLPGLAPEQDVVDWFEGRNPDERRRELEELIANARPKRPDFELVTALIHEPDEPVAYLVDDLILDEGSVLVYAQPRAGKTLAILEICFAVSTGTTAFGLDRFTVPSPVSVLYLTEEDPRLHGKRRLRALARGRGLDEAPFRVAFMKGFHLDRKRDQDRLIEATVRYGARLVVLDPLSRLTHCVGGTAKDFAPFGDYLQSFKRETGAVILCAAHDAKRVGLDPDEVEHAHAVSGGGILEAFDSPIHLVRRGDVHQLIPTGYKFTDTPEPFVYSLETSGAHPNDPDYSMRLVGATRTEEEAKQDERREAILRYLQSNPCAITRDVTSGCGGNAQESISELKRLVRVGLIECHDGERRAKHYRLNGQPCACDEGIES